MIRIVADELGFDIVTEETKYRFYYDEPESFYQLPDVFNRLGFAVSWENEEDFDYDFQGTYELY